MIFLNMTRVICCNAYFRLKTARIDRVKSSKVGFRVSKVAASKAANLRVEFPWRYVHGLAIKYLLNQRRPLAFREDFIVPKSYGNFVCFYDVPMGEFLYRLKQWYLCVLVLLIINIVHLKNLTKVGFRHYTGETTILWYHAHVAASKPIIISSITDSCTVEGENVTLTCQVMYNGTNLMPMKMEWTSWPSSIEYWTDYLQSYHRFIIKTLNAVNSSSVFQTTYTFVATGQATNEFECAVIFSPPTGFDFYVQRQYTNAPVSHFWSSPYPSRTVASELLAWCC